MLSRRTIAVLVGICCFIVGLGPDASASGAQKRVSFTSHFEDPGPFVLPSRCGPQEPGLCEFVGTGTVTWTGRLSGTSEYRVFAHYDPATGDVPFEVWERFITVTIKGCGRGSGLWHGRGVVHTSELDPATLSFSANATWRLVKGSGRGDLADTSRSVFRITEGRFFLPTLANSGDVTGYARCAKP